MCILDQNFNKNITICQKNKKLIFKFFVACPKFCTLKTQFAKISVLQVNPPPPKTLPGVIVFLMNAGAKGGGNRWCGGGYRSALCPILL